MLALNQSGIYHFPRNFQKKIFEYHGMLYHEPEYESGQFKFEGFNEYNYLVDINSIFSTAPGGDIVDRTLSTKMPVNMYIHRPWQQPNLEKSLDDCFQNTVQNIESHGPVNLFWSGGIDSTSMVIAFLKYAKDLTQVRIMYSTFSVKENPNFYLHLLDIGTVELVEFSGDIYLNQKFDGIFVSGDGLDDLTASLDDSFFDYYGWEYLKRPWQDLFYSKIKNDKFIEFAEQFNSTHWPVNTVLEARWWYYTNCKIQKFPSSGSAILNDDQPLLIGFYDNYDFEHYMFAHINDIIPEKRYTSYKQTFKNFIFDYDKNKQYHERKKKTTSMQLVYYYYKKLALKNTNYIMILGDGTRIRTPNLPLLSEREYRNKYGDSLNYLFNTP